MQIKVNKDFLHEYKNDVWKGFSVPEIAGIAAALACNGAVTFIFWKYLGISPDNAVYLGIPAMLPALVAGFVRMQDNASLIEYARAMYDTYRCKELSFHGEAYARRGHEFYMIHKNRRTGGRRIRKEGKKR